MLIDCAKCPVRNRECDDCMMQLLFEPATSMFSESDAEADLIAAVGVFVDTGLISPEAANLACADVAAGHSVTTDDGRLRLRAV